MSSLLRVVPSLILPLLLLAVTCSGFDRGKPIGWSETQEERRAQEKICEETSVELFLTPINKELSEYGLSTFTELTDMALSHYVRLEQSLQRINQRMIDRASSTVTSQVVKSVLTVDNVGGGARRMKQNKGDSFSKERSLIAPGQPVTITPSLSLSLHCCAFLEPPEPDIEYTEIDLRDYINDFFVSNGRILSAFIEGSRSMDDEDGDMPLAMLSSIGVGAPAAVSDSVPSGLTAASSQTGASGEDTETNALAADDESSTFPAYSLGIAGALIALAAIVGLLVVLLLSPRKKQNAPSMQIVERKQLPPAHIAVSPTRSQRSFNPSASLEEDSDHEETTREVPLLANEPSNSSSDDSDCYVLDQEENQEEENQEEEKQEEENQEKPDTKQSQRAKRIKEDIDEEPSQQQERNQRRNRFNEEQHSMSYGSPATSSYHSSAYPYQSPRHHNQVLTSPTFYAHRGTPIQTFGSHSISSPAGTQSLYQGSTPRMGFSQATGNVAKSSPIVVSQPLSESQTNRIDENTQGEYTPEYTTGYTTENTTENITENTTENTTEYTTEYTTTISEGEYTSTFTDGEQTADTVSPRKKEYSDEPTSPWQNFLGGFKALMDSPPNSKDQVKAVSQSDPFYTVDRGDTTFSDFPDDDDKRKQERRNRRDERKRGRSGGSGGSGGGSSSGRDSNRSSGRDGDRRREEVVENKKMHPISDRKSTRARHLHIGGYADVDAGGHEFYRSDDDSASIEIQYTPRNKKVVEELYDDPPPPPSSAVSDSRKNSNQKMSKKTKKRRDLEKAKAKGKKEISSSGKTQKKAKGKSDKPKGVLKNKRNPQKQPITSDDLYIIPEDDTSV